MNITLSGAFPIYVMYLVMNRSLEHVSVSRAPLIRDTLTKAGKLGLRLLEDLTAIAASGSVSAILEVLFYFKTVVTGFFVYLLVLLEQCLLLYFYIVVQL